MSDQDEQRPMLRSQPRESWISTDGSEVCSGTEFDWSFKMESTALVARLVRNRSYDQRDAEAEIRLWLADYLSERISLMIAEFWRLTSERNPVDAGHVCESQTSDTSIVSSRHDVLAQIRAKLKQKQSSIAQGNELRTSEAASNQNQMTEASKAIEWQASRSGSAHEPSIASLLSGSSIDPEKWEFFLSDGSGDEWFEVIDRGGGSSRQKGDLVGVNRGDKLKILFNAISISTRESPGFVYEADAEISADGELLLVNGRQQVFGRFPAAEPARKIFLDRKNGNSVRFSRTDRAMPSHDSPLGLDKDGIESCVAGHEQFNAGTIDWSLDFRSEDIIEHLAQRAGRDQAWALATLGERLAERVSLAINDATSWAEFDCRRPLRPDLADVTVVRTAPDGTRIACLKRPDGLKQP